MKHLKTFFAAATIFNAFMVLRAVNVLNDTPLAIGCTILTAICLVAWMYCKELININSK